MKNTRFTVIYWLVQLQEITENCNLISHVDCMVINTANYNPICISLSCLIDVQTRKINILIKPL